LWAAQQQLGVDHHCLKHKGERTRGKGDVMRNKKKRKVEVPRLERNEIGVVRPTRTAESLAIPQYPRYIRSLFPMNLSLPHTLQIHIHYQWHLPPGLDCVFRCVQDNAPNDHRARTTLRSLASRAKANGSGVEAFPDIPPGAPSWDGRVAHIPKKK